jgi:hypothetical protein
MTNRARAEKLLDELGAENNQINRNVVRIHFMMVRAWQRIEDAEIAQAADSERGNEKFITSSILGRELEY